MIINYEKSQFRCVFNVSLRLRHINRENIYKIYRKNYIYFTMLYISKYIIINIFVYGIFFKYFFPF